MESQILTLLEEGKTIQSAVTSLSGTRDKTNVTKLKQESELINKCNE